jgi:UDPglucose 6-dehydrogenase
VLAAVLADKGFTVSGVDVNPEYVRAINEGRAPVEEEPGLDELIRKNHQRLSATTDCEAAAVSADVTFMVVPTPSGPDGLFSLQFVDAALEPIGRALGSAGGFPLVVLSSTVIPGSCGGHVTPALERISGKKCGRDFGFCYNPEFIALGSVIRDMRNPDMILIGESDPRSGQILEDLYRRVCDNDPSFARMNFVNAELTKISVNTFVTTKISYANMLAEVCEKLPGADVDVVTAALGLDTRIGRKYLKGALGYGGPCFPRDNIAFASLARKRGVDPVLAEATDLVNRRQAPRLADLMLRLLPEGGTAGILGLSYKPDTGIIEESQGVMLARALLDRGVPVVAYDPAAMPEARAALTGNIRFAASVAECAATASVLAITTPWPEFMTLRPEHLNTSRGRPAIVDCWRLLWRAGFDAVADYVTLGVGIEAGEPARPAVPEAVAASD